MSAFDSDDAELKRIIVANSRATLVAALNEKVGTVAAFPVLDLLSCDHLVVEASLETSKLGALRSIKSDIILA